MTSPDLTHELRLAVPASAKETFSELLLHLGISGFVEGSIDCDIPFEYGEEHFRHDYYADHDQGSPFILYDPSRETLEAHLKAIINNLEQWNLKETDLRVNWASVADQDWKESWKESFRPLHVGAECVILPPWEDPESFAAKEKIIINPGMAFGTGQHETTQLCLKVYLDETKRSFDRVFDVGTGSGILAIAAVKFGCSQVLGCDIDADSVRIARENAELNSCPEIVFTADRLNTLSTTENDLIFANIQAKPLSKILADIVSRGSPKCTYIFSGILAEEEQWFAEQMSAHGLVAQKTLAQGDWLGILAQLKVKD